MEVKPKVVDLSHYDNVGPTPKKTTTEGFKAAYDFGIRGVINKVTEGLLKPDKSFEWRREPAQEAGMLYAAYHFLRPGSIEAQVDHFLEHAKPDNKLGLALDHEDARVPLHDAGRFIELVHQKTGQWPSLYSGFLVKQQIKPSNYAFWKNIRLWLCHYSAHPSWPTKCWDNPWLWQYTGDGVGPKPHDVPGITISGGLDINSFLGTDEELAKTWVQT